MSISSKGILHGTHPVHRAGPDGHAARRPFHVDRRHKQFSLHGPCADDDLRSRGQAHMKRALILAVLLSPRSAASARDSAAPRQPQPSQTRRRPQRDNSSAPITVSADTFPADLNGQDRHLYRQCHGHAGRHQACAPTRCGSSSINGQAADKISANGNVVVNSPSGTATGDTGVYDRRPTHRHADAAMSC